MSRTGECAAVICGVGASLPETVVSNTDLCARLDTTEEWIRSRTGIARRRIAGPQTSTQDLAVEAAANAITCARPPCRISALVLATTTPDVTCPATAPGVAARLGLAGIPALDLAAGCSGFLYALAVASALLTSATATGLPSGPAEPAAAAAPQAVLVIGADRLSTLPDPGDRSTVPLFGDGAGAMLLRHGTATEAGALGPLLLGSDGTHDHLIRAGHPRALRLQGAEVFRHAVERMTAAATAAAQAAGWSIHDVDHLVAHQANARITAFVAKQLGVAEPRPLHNVEEVGNTGAASIPLLLTQAAAGGRLQPASRLLLTAFGSGLTWGATTVTWPDLNPRHPTPPHPAKEPQ
jgi:3-oxoacyl-[acyl-carrier-protein] synthase-3